MHQENEEVIRRSRITECPRCGANGYEILRTHNHCLDCLYFENKDEPSLLMETFFAEKAIANYQKKVQKSVKGIK